MSHAARQAPHGIHLLRLAELSLKLLPLNLKLLSLFFVPLQRVAHVLEGLGDLCYLITTVRFQRVDEITLFEGPHSLREVRQRTRGPVRNHKHQYPSP